MMIWSDHSGPFDSSRPRLQRLVSRTTLLQSPDNSNNKEICAKQFWLARIWRNNISTSWKIGLIPTALALGVSCGDGAPGRTGGNCLALVQVHGRPRKVLNFD